MSDPWALWPSRFQFYSFSFFYQPSKSPEWDTLSFWHISCIDFIQVRFKSLLFFLPLHLLQQLQKFQLILQSQLSPPCCSTTLGNRKKQVFLSRYELAYAAAIFCDSILIRICWKWGKREKWRAVEGRGGWRRGAVKKVFPSLCQKAESGASVLLPWRFFEDT